MASVAVGEDAFPADAQYWDGFPGPAGFRPYFGKLYTGRVIFSFRYQLRCGFLTAPKRFLMNLTSASDSDNILQ